MACSRVRSGCPITRERACSEVLPFHLPFSLLPLCFFSSSQLPTPSSKYLIMSMQADPNAKPNPKPYPNVSDSVFEQFKSVSGKLVCISGAGAGVSIDQRLISIDPLSLSSSISRDPGESCNFLLTFPSFPCLSLILADRIRSC